MKKGNIYFLNGFTAPKVFTGTHFECLLTDQKIDGSAKIAIDTKIAIKDWLYPIYMPERFKELLKQ